MCGVCGGGLTYFEFFSESASAKISCENRLNIRYGIISERWSLHYPLLFLTAL